jgi:hypothetical protein
MALLTVDTPPDPSMLPLAVSRSRDEVWIQM